MLWYLDWTVCWLSLWLVGEAVKGYGLRARSARLRLVRSAPDVSGRRGSFRKWCGGFVPRRRAGFHRRHRVGRAVAMKKVDNDSTIVLKNFSIFRLLYESSSGDEVMWD